MDKQTPILILGAGTFGLSTAYHLATAGYTNVTVLEQSATFPPALSAGNDLNKIVRAEYEDPFYADLALEAMAAWEAAPLFAPHYHATGYLLCTSAAAPEKAKASLRKSLGSIRDRPAFRGKITPVASRDDIRRVAPAFDGPMKDWEGYFNRFAGYASAADALAAVYSACIALGVTIHLDSAVQSLTFCSKEEEKEDKDDDDNDDDDDGACCTGAVTTSGERYSASVTVLALGASLGAVLPQIKRQVIAKAAPVAHIQLTADEAAKLRGLPVTYARDLGFFFEPDRRTDLLKICPSVAGYTNYYHDHGTSSGLSLPPADNAFIPAEDEEKIRRLLRETLPGLAERPLVGRRLCWCADSADSEYVVDAVPGKKGLVVITGDTAHGFKMLPIAGKWVRDVVEKGRQENERWRWKEGSDAAAAELSWKVGKTTDLKEVEAFRRDPPELHST